MESITQTDDARFIEQLKYCKSLPTLPTVALQLIELAEDGTTTLDEFAELIAFDPALVGKLLRAANSPFYGHRRKVSSLSEAISLMGLNATVSLSLSFSLRGLTSELGEGSLDDTHYWSRSLLTALAARTIAIKLREPQPEDYLLAGLLQDIGVLAMSSILGSSYVKLYQGHVNHADLLRDEVEQYGYNHAQAGAQLLKHWRLPDRICESVWRSHAVQRVEDDSVGANTRRLSLYVDAAAHLADAWIQGATIEAFDEAYVHIKPLLGGISTERYEQIITSMSESMPEMETLFEAELLDRSVLQGIQDSARELLSLHNLRLSQATEQADKQIQRFEQRIAMLESQTRRDPLTGLYNRVYLDHRLEQEFAIAQRENQPLSVAYVDVDHFKAVNDTFGHAVGDQVLVTVAHRLLSGARQTDTVARYGGEEFIVLLPETDAGDARLMLERILGLVRGAPSLTRDSQNVHVTFSAGIATLKTGGPEFLTPADLLEAADRALYKTKSNGRGQITVYDPYGKP